MLVKSTLSTLNRKVPIRMTPFLALILTACSDEEPCYNCEVLDNSNGFYLINEMDLCGSEDARAFEEAWADPQANISAACTRR